jgi:phospholipid transport system substrate-binding protein
MTDGEHTQIFSPGGGRGCNTAENTSARSLNRNRILLSFLLLFSIGFLGGYVHAQSSPIPMLQQTSDSILGVLKVNKVKLKQNPSVVFGAVKTYMVPHVDVEGMSRSVLGRQAWTKATASERAEFKEVFTQLVIRTYATPLAEYTSETVAFLPVRGSLDGQFVRVNSVIHRPSGQSIPLSYSLVAHDGQWKIYDLSVEGVSLLQSFRSQFAGVLQNSDMQTLLHEMRERSKAAA